MNNAISLLAGLLFGLGLIISGMADPAKVLGFLDFTAAWDPSLALVMAGAIGVGLPAFRVAQRRTTTLLGQDTCLPAVGKIDRRLLLGSAVFGIGWGLAGICPGPGLVMLGIAPRQGAIFVAAFFAGLLLFELQQAAPTRAFFSRIYKHLVTLLFSRRKACTR